jgi:hypothetical protein
MAPVACLTLFAAITTAQDLTFNYEFDFEPTCKKPVAQWMWVTFEFKP